MLKLCGLQVEYYLILLIREYLHQRRYLLTQQPSSLFYSYERTASLSVQRSAIHSIWNCFHRASERTADADGEV